MPMRLPAPPDLVTEMLTGKQTLYTVMLSAAPSPPWRAAFLRPPLTLTTVTYRPELCRLDLNGATMLFLAAPDRYLDRVCQLGGGGMTKVSSARR
jgi:hypothetical protein